MDSVPRFTVVRFHGHQPISVYEGTRNQVFIWLLMNPGIVDPDHAVYDRETLVTERIDFFKEMIHEELSKKRLGVENTMGDGMGTQAKLHGLINEVREFGKTGPVNVGDYIVRVADRIETLLGRSPLKMEEHFHITRMLRQVADFARFNNKAANDFNVNLAMVRIMEMSRQDDLVEKVEEGFLKNCLLGSKRPEIDPVIAYTDGVEKIIPIKGDDMQNNRELILQVIELTRCHPKKSSEELYAMFPAQPDGKPKRDLNHAHIDNIKFSVMENIHALVKQAAQMGQSNPDRDLSESILGYTSEIVELVSGVSREVKTQMNKNRLVWSTFRNVKEAIETVALEGLDFTDSRITRVTEEYTARIVNTMVGIDDEVAPSQMQFVDQYYEMDPETEDLLDNGTLVIPGMKVLIEEPQMRQSISNNLESATLDKARTMNRWATVVSSSSRTEANETSLTFVALYDDGIKRKIRVPVRYAWLVKKNTIPRMDTLMTEDGTVLEFKTTAGLVELLKQRMKFMGDRFNPEFHKVETGKGGDVIPLSEYLVNEGLMAQEGDHT